MAHPLASASMACLPMLRRLLFTVLGCVAAAAALAAGDGGGHGHCHAAAPQPAALSTDRTPVPLHFHAALARLAVVLDLPPGVRPQLVGVQSNRSAFVRADGTISLSSRLWTDHALDADEAAAVVAHELAHLELAHLGQACGAVASLGRQEVAATAGGTREILRAVRAGDHALATRLMRANHLRELDADRRAAELLGLAGLPPTAVGSMLVKLARGDGGSYSGSHPALDTRLENLGLRLVP